MSSKFPFKESLLWLSLQDLSYVSTMTFDGKEIDSKMAVLPGFPTEMKRVSFADLTRTIATGVEFAVHFARVSYLQLQFHPAQQ